MKRYGLLIVLFVMLLTTACSSSETETQVVAPTRDELCIALGRNPDTDPLCDASHSPSVLLRDVFPVGTTTRQQVDKLLGQYRTYSMPRAIGGVIDTYVVQRTLLNPITASFTFDENDVLEIIVIED